MHRQRLDVGDAFVHITVDALQQRGLCVERKTVADLCASIADGRWKEQKARMIAPEVAYVTS